MKNINKPEKLSSFYFANWLTLLAITITGVFYNVGMLANPIFQGKLIDMMTQKSFLNDISILYKTILLYFLTIVSVQIVRSLKRFFTRKFAYDAVSQMRHIVYNNILSMSENDMAKKKMGTLISRVMSDIDKTVEGMRKLVTEIFDTVVLFLVYMIYLFCFDFKITAFSLISVFIGVLISFAFRKLNYKYSSLARKSNSSLSSKTFEMMDHAMMFRIYGRDDDNLKDYDKNLKEYEKYNKLVLFVKDTMIPFSTIVALIGLIPLVFLGTGYVFEGKVLSIPAIGAGETVWTTGVFTNYLTAFVLLCNKTGHTAKLFSSVESGLASWKRIQPYIHAYQDYPIGHVEENKGDVLSFSNYSLSVSGRNLIQNLNLDLHSGKIIGITGVISSGKSAFAKSLIGKIPYQGSVKLFGKELSSYAAADLASCITYMGHRPQLFTDMIKENVSFGDSKDVLPYLESVSFLEDFKTMPEKENSIVGNEGVRLSGGQQQRIALARSLYHRKSILILDDPFSNVDQKTEYEIIASIRKMLGDSLVILISHRLSAFKDFDGILVLHGDSTFDYGTHEELLKKSEIYQKLYSIQRESKEVEDD